LLIAFHKPFDVLSQFTKELPHHRTLGEFGFPPGVYPIGRLDRDSEGLLLLSDEARWTERLLNPRQAHPRTYHAQLEGIATPTALEPLRIGVRLKEFRALPCTARLLLEKESLHPARQPPIRFRKSIPTSWISLTLTEGKNRQVRRMTAAIGLPTLRLVRVAIGQLQLAETGLENGQWRELTAAEQEKVTQRHAR